MQQFRFLTLSFPFNYFKQEAHRKKQNADNRKDINLYNILGCYKTCKL